MTYRCEKVVVSRLNSAVFVDVKQGGKPVESITASLSDAFLSTRGILGIATPSCALSVYVVYSVTPVFCVGSKRYRSCVSKSRFSPAPPPMVVCLRALGALGWLCSMGFRPLV